MRIFAERAHRYENRLKYPIVSLFMENRDKHIRNFLRSGSGALLDLGAGTGYYLNGFAKNFSSINAIDSSKEMLNIFKNNNRGKKFIAIKSDALKFSASKKFDRILCIGLLNYLGKTDAAHLVRKIYSLLKNGGKVLLSAPDEQKVSGRAYKQIWKARGVKINLYSKKFLLEKMRAAGFRNIHVRNEKDFTTFHIILEAGK